MRRPTPRNPHPTTPPHGVRTPPPHPTESAPHHRDFAGTPGPRLRGDPGTAISWGPRGRRPQCPGREGGFRKGGSAPPCSFQAAGGPAGAGCQLVELRRQRREDEVPCAAVLNRLASEAGLELPEPVPGVALVRGVRR